MKNFKIYKVKVEFETVIRATNQEEAEKLAQSIVKTEDDQASLISSSEIQKEQDLPKGWDKWCLPWGERHPMDWEICRQLNWP